MFIDRLGAVCLMFATACKLDSSLAPPPDAILDSPPTDTPTAKPRLYALTNAGPLDFSVRKVGLEIVDLETMSLVRRVDLPDGAPASLEISGDGKTAYVSDVQAEAIRFIDTETGEERGDPVGGIHARSIALSRDGTKLFAAANGFVIEIDTATRETRSSPNVGAGRITLGLATSPDGARIAATTFDTTPAGANVAVIRTSDMSIEATIPTTTDVAACTTAPAAAEMHFASNTQLLAWDSSCDELYQFDVSTHTQLTASSVPTPLDVGASGNFSNRFRFSEAAKLGYAIKEDRKLAIVNPMTKTFTLVATFADLPYTVGVDPDGKRVYVIDIHRFDAGGADTLTTIDTATTLVTHDAYTFSRVDESVVDMDVVISP